jgi:hypothetical protein
LSKQPASLDDLMNEAGAVDGTDEEASTTYEFGSLAEWPDEDKPKVEASFRRRRPLPGTFVLLGNDETWLIPDVAYLGNDIEVFEKRNIFGRLSVSFSAQTKKYLKLKELLCSVMESGEETGTASWTDAYMLMYLALKVNYKIPADEITKLGLLREEHASDIIAALVGACKKKERPIGLDIPSPDIPGM